MRMITPSPGARGANHKPKKRRPKAPLCVAFPATSERMLYAKRDGGHVRACGETAVGAVASVCGRASDVIIVRADPVIDLVVGDVHLGALGHDIVVAHGQHFRLSRVATRRASDHQVPGSSLGVESSRLSAALPARGLAPARPHLARARVNPTVDDLVRHLHPGIYRARYGVV